MTPLSLHRVRCFCVATALAIGAGLATPAPSSAQLPPSRSNTDRRELVDDLLKSLIESELDRREIRDDRTFTRDNDPSRRISPTPRVVNSPTQQMLQARRLLQDVSAEADRLTARLNADVRRVPEIRPYMTDMLKQRARVAVLAQRAQQVNDHEEIRPDLQNLDRDWRVLAYRLQRIRGIDPQILASIDRINSYAKTVASAYEMQPQIKYQELLQQTSALAMVLNNLMDDIEIEVRDPEQRTQLLLTGRRIEQQSRQVVDMVANREQYDRVVSQYKSFQNMWYPYATRLRPIENRYLERGVRRIQEVDNTIHELLWLPQEMDRQQLLHLTNVLKKDVDNFFLRAPLKLLIELPDSELVISTANEFYGVCDNFVDLVNHGESEAGVQDAYQYISEAWEHFNLVFGRLSSPAAHQVLNDIERSILALREALQIREGFNNRDAVELAASLENLAFQLDRNMQSWLNARREVFRAEALRESSDFVANCHKLHAALATQAPQTQVRQNVTQLYESWRRLYDYASRCTTAERHDLRNVSAQITPVLVELQTLVGNYSVSYRR